VPTIASSFGEISHSTPLKTGLVSSRATENALRLIIFSSA